MESQAGFSPVFLYGIFSALVLCLAIIIEFGLNLIKINKIKYNT